MNRRRYLSLLAALALCALLLSACGSSSSSSTSTSSTTSSSTQSTPSATTSSTSSTATTTPTTSTPATATPPADIKAATEQCKNIIQAQTKLPEGAKKKLESACEKAAKGDTSAVKTAAREVCEEVVKTSSVPNGSAKEAALASCKK